MKVISGSQCFIYDMYLIAGRLLASAACLSCEVDSENGIR